MIRPFCLACEFFFTTALWGVAGEPKSIFVGVPDLNLAAEVSEILPGIRIGVIEVHADEPDAIVDARAIALQEASHLLFDGSKESPRLAMFRERLEAHGVVAINIGGSSLQRHKSMRPINSPQLEQLASLLSQLSKSGE
jgi:hypothetical protein